MEKGEISLSLLLETLQAIATPAGADNDPSRRVSILIDADAFKKEKMMDFDPEKIQIKISSKLVGVSLATVLRIIAEQLDGTYWVRRDYIEIVPADMAIREKVTRVFPVADLIIGIPNAINQNALQQSLSALGQTFSLGGGFRGGPVVFNGNNVGGFQIGGFGGGGQQGGGAQNAALGAGAAGGLFNGGCAGGIAGFGGGVQGNIGSGLGGQFGFQGQDYSQPLVTLITEVVAKGEWAVSPNLLCAGGGGAGAADPDPNAGPTLAADKLNSLGYWQPARGLIVRGTSRVHRTNSSKLKPAGMMPAAFIPPGGAEANVIGKIGGNFAKAEPKAMKIPIHDADRRCDEIVQQIIEKEKDLPPEKIYQMVLDHGLTAPGEIIACADFMVGCKQFKHAAELLKAALRAGVVAEPWAQEALAIALEGSQGSPTEIERARVSGIDLAPKSAIAYVKASKAMADMGQLDTAMKFCREAARLEPGLPDAYVNALVFAGDKKATLDSDISAFAAGNLLGRDWTVDTAEYHLRAREHLKGQAEKFVAQNKMADAQKLQTILENENRRDLVIELMWSGEADLDLKVREPIGTNCTSIQRQTAAGGILLCDDFTQKVDNRSETYTAAEAYNGSYEVSVDRVWGRPLGEKATVKVTRNQGTPKQIIELHTLYFTKDKPQPKVFLSFDSGRRTTLASVPLAGVAPGASRKPEREDQVMNKLRAMTNGTSVPTGMGGGVGRQANSRDNSDSPLMEISHQASISSIATGGMEIRQQTTLAKDGKSVQVTMAPVFNGGAAAKQGKVKLDFIPGAE